MKQFSVHIDLDSPQTLLKFWGSKSDSVDLDKFYEIAMGRALALLREHGIAATFFCVGQELDSCRAFRNAIRMAVNAGHEIANHSYSHPFRLSKLSSEEIRKEVARCGTIIEEITGVKPVGFRSPGYQIDNNVLEVLHDLGYLYDSSAFYSSLQQAFKMYYKFFSRSQVERDFGSSNNRVPHEPYIPSKSNWTIKSSNKSEKYIIEIPLPRTQIFNLPIYNNFLLSMRNLYPLILFLMNQSYFVYLLHIIEFVDLEDKVPTELSAHPNIKIPVKKKIEYLKKILNNIMTKHTIVRTDNYVKNNMASFRG